MVLAVAAYLAAPLFFDRTVDEPMQLSPGGSATQFDLDQVMTMSADERLAQKSEIMAAAAGQPDRTIAETMSDTSPSVVARGNFVDADTVHRGAGAATLYALPEDEHLVRLENLNVTNGPDLVVYLAKHSDPKNAADVTDGGFVSLGKLKGNVGNQNYPVPAGVDVSEYGSVVIWCELFGVLFSPASLAP